MKNLVLSVLLVISIGMATAVSVNKLFADEWSLFKVIFLYYCSLMLLVLFVLTHFLLTGCSLKVIHRI